MELKYSDRDNITVQDITLAGTTPELLNGLDPGSDFDERIGRKVVIKSIMVLGQIYRDVLGAIGGATNLQPNIIRMIVVYDLQTNVNTPAPSDIINNGNQGGVAYLDANTGINPNYRNRWVVLCDKRFPIGSFIYGSGLTPASSSTNPDCHSVRWYKKCNLPVIFNQNITGGVGDISNGAIWIMFISNTSVANCNLTATYSTRIRFVDA